MTAALETQVAAAADAIRQQWPTPPKAGLILGSGLGELTAHMRVEARLSYDAIPHFCTSTAPGHRGELLGGTFGSTPVVAMSGRFHLYEGCTPQEVTFPVRVMRRLGVETLILTNACGGMNPNYAAGDILVLDDHIDLLRGSPLCGPHDAGSDPQCFDMSRPYDPQLIAQALEIARRGGFAAHQGVYVGVTGPNYETRAEYRFFRRIGGDAVGMSTVQEVIIARQCKLRVLALSVVTNVCLPDRPQTTTAQQVIDTAQRAEPKLRAIITGVLNAQ